MDVKNVIIVVKKTALKRLKGRADARLDNAMKGLVATDRQHGEALAEVRRVAKSLGCKVEVIQRGSLPKLAERQLCCDLIITVGGDGTTLKTSHFIVDTPLLGVNSNPKHSVGMLCGATAANVGEVLVALMKNRIKPLIVQRLAAFVDGVATAPPALNEMLFSHESPASTTRYEITYRGKIQSQKSSGIWVATAAGSTAAAFTAGAKAMPIESKVAQFAVRELYDPRGKGALRIGSIRPGEIFSIANSTSDAALYVDGETREYSVPFGHEITFSLHKHPLKLIGYNRERRAIAAAR